MTGHSHPRRVYIYIPSSRVLLNFYSDQMAATNETVLTKIAEAFNELADDVNSCIAEAFNELADDVNSCSTPPRLSLSKFCSACRLLSPLIGCLGIAFRFADMEFSAKVDGLAKASESIDTIEALIDLDIAHNAGRDSGSNSRNLIRANRSVDLVRIIFEQILAQSGNGITDPVLTAYEQVFGPYHSLAMKTAVRALALTVPTKARLWRKLNENEASGSVQMQKFVIASSAVIQHINNLFHSTEYGDELLGMI
ncbi:hypothetical protein RHMOL_Rhmol09G0187600 [Rhododendron molle]|uniref:Uncharacterized protein n=1 Tax=Rhododendron molle TaxID=49168 RepID=A0ACC0MFX1_RHOML|nr:hypothetical protein RHMOL_Rhmol09G0187600 [Rhododendron molle]